VQRPTTLEELGERSLDGDNIVKIVLECVKDDVSIEIHVIVNQYVPEANHADPTLPQFFLHVAVVG